MAQVNYMGAEMPDKTQGSAGSMVSAVISERVSMGKKDVLQHFAQHDMMDELMICGKYLDYYNAAKDECRETAHVCKEMAADEWSHARAQRDLMMKNGYTMTDEGMAKFEEIKHRIEETFR